MTGDDVTGDGVTGVTTNRELLRLRRPHRHPVTTLTDERFDVVLNLVPTSPEETVALAGLVRPDGVLLSTTTPIPDTVGVRAVSVFVRGDAEQLAELVGRVDAGTLSLDVAERVALADLPSVHARSDAGTLHGKTAVTV
ncbi:hypothetical protein GCM10010254_60000 [Streptomyces chromofuscus]|nr:hypothetical protein GCM10010254_60000 [Streptomyces chromofuscus]